MRSNTDNNNVSIKLLDKEFLIACPAENQAELIDSAKLLEQRMREIKASGRVFGLERIAVMAALNLSHELLQSQQATSSDQESARQFNQLEQRIQQVLATTEKD